MVPEATFGSQAFLTTTELMDGKMTNLLWTHREIGNCPMVERVGPRDFRTRYAHMADYITKCFSAALLFLLPSDLVVETLPESAPGMNSLEALLHIHGGTPDDGPEDVWPQGGRLDPMTLVLPAEDATPVEQGQVGGDRL